MNIKELNLFYINGDSKPLIVKSSNENIDFFFSYKKIILKVNQFFNTKNDKFKNHLFLCNINIIKLNLFYINVDSNQIIFNIFNENIIFFFSYKQIILKVKQLFNTQTAKYKNHLFTGKSQIGEALCLGQRYTRFEFLLPEV